MVIALKIQLDNKDGILDAAKRKAEIALKIQKDKVIWFIVGSLLVGLVIGGGIVIIIVK